MSIVECLSRLVSDGKISQQQADDARAIHDRILNDDMFRDMGQATKEAYAAKRTAQILDEAAKLKKQELAFKVNRWIENTARVDAHPNGPMAGVMGLFDRDFRNAPGENRINATSLERDVYRPAIATKMHEFDDAYSSKLAGIKQDVSGIRNMIQELKGVDTGDPVAKMAAKSWKNATDYAAAKAQQLGKGWKPDEDWKLPQFWEADRVRQFGDGAFKADIQKEIDGGGLKVFDRDTRQPVVDPAKRAEIIDGASRDIRMDQNRTTGPSSVFKDETRVFRFPDDKAGSAAYLRLMDKYGAGEGGYFNMMQSHAQSMARELSMLHQFGPDFRASTSQLVDYAIAKSAERSLDPPVRTAGEKLGDFFMRWVESPTAAKVMQKFMTGQLSGVEGKTMASMFGGVRAFMTATKLGGAVLSAVPGDTVNALMASSYHGLNSGRLINAIVHNLFVHDPEREAIALKLGIITHTVSREAITSARFGDELIGKGVFQKFAQGVIRASGLHAWDDALRSTFSQEFLASLGDRMGKPFGELDEPFARFLTDFGFTPADWSKISAAQAIGPGPVKFLLPSSIEDEALRVKLLSAIGDVKQFAYLAGGSNRMSAIATGGAARGTWARESSQSFFQFKIFVTRGNAC
jgi:hypothetical protein